MHTVNVFVLKLLHTFETGCNEISAIIGICWCYTNVCFHAREFFLGASLVCSLHGMHLGTCTCAVNIQTCNYVCVYAHTKTKAY